MQIGKPFIAVTLILLTTFGFLMGFFAGAYKESSQTIDYAMKHNDRFISAFLQKDTLNKMFEDEKAMKKIIARAKRRK